MQRSRSRARCRTLAFAAVFAAQIGPQAALAGPAEEAEELARAIYYEGVPEDAARSLDDAGIERLDEMLADPAEADHHGTIVSLLGASGHPAAFDALADYAAEPLAGEVDRATFRARTRLPGAMGRLAHDDRRALTWLLSRSAERPAPGWSFRHQRDAKLAALLDGQNLGGLALTGAPEALQALRQAQRDGRGSGATPQERRDSLSRVIETHDRVARGGLDALREENAR